jgi:hypothetical protein
MSILDIVKTLEPYSGAGATNPPANVHQDFEQVAQSAPQPQLASGIAEAFRSNQTPPFGQMLGTLFSQSNGQQQAGILNQLLGSLGPAAAGAGALGGLSSILGGGGQVTPQQAQQVPPETVQQLAEQAQKNNPSIIDQAGSFYAQHPTLVKALGAGSLAMIMSHMSRNQ